MPFMGSLQPRQRRFCWPAADEGRTGGLKVLGDRGSAGNGGTGGGWSFRASNLSWSELNDRSDFGGKLESWPYWNDGSVGESGPPRKNPGGGSRTTVPWRLWDISIPDFCRRGRLTELSDGGLVDAVLPLCASDGDESVDDAGPSTVVSYGFPNS